MEEEKIKKMAEYRTSLEKRIHEKEIEMESLRTLMNFVDAILLRDGFKRVEIKTQSKIINSEVAEEFIPLKTVTNELLARISIQEESMLIVPDKEKAFDINTPPFSTFLLEKVLEGMLKKDKEAMDRGEVPPNKMLSYNILRNGDVIKEIKINNITQDRKRELISAIRWTLEKMWQKKSITT